jgi:hypothetical protein
MKAKFLWVIIGVFVVGCATKPQAAPPEQAKSAKVYYEGTGSDHDVKRFGKFLDIALDDYGLTRTDSATNADAVVKVQFEEKEEIASLYSPVVWATFTSRKGEEYIVKSCSSVSSGDNIFKQPIKYVGDVTLPVAWKKGQENLSIYIDEPALKDSAELVKVLKESLPEQHYRLVKTRSEADAELKSIVLQKFSAPERTIAHSHTYQIVDKESRRISSGTGNSSTYLGLEKSVNVKNIPCGATMASYGNVSSYDSLWGEAKDMAKAIHKDINKEAANSN